MTNAALVWALLALSLSSLLCGVSAKHDNNNNKADLEGLLVKTTQGLVQGHINAAGIREWRGIPYALPPVGELRWADPVSANPHEGVYEATFNAPGCPQHCNLPPGNCPEWGTSEDCLYLSVYAPRTPPSRPDTSGYPVFVWIHGGAFEQGLGNCALYNGSALALQGVVTVVLNYRLGALGFLASRTLGGNYGFLDQRLALQWTRDNAAAFGGDRERITLGGQSAGAMSVGAHLVSPRSQSLFSRGVLESNPLGLPFHTRESATSNADAVAAYLQCPTEDVACLRARSAEEVLDAQDHAVSLDLDTLLLNFLPFAPLVEREGEIPRQPMDALRDAEFPANRALLQGSVQDEGQLFVYELFTKPLGRIAYEGTIAGVFGVHNAPRILRAYPFEMIENNSDARNVLNVLATDLLFFCPLRNITQGYQKTYSSKQVPTYMYRFEHVESFDCWGENYTFCQGVCCHGSELPYVFDVFTDGVSVSYTPTPDEMQLATDLGNAWVNFIHRGDPNKGYSVPARFPLYESATDRVLTLDEPTQKVESHLRKRYCDMWDELGYFY